jgi:nitrile hydratase subunit alpha
MTPEHAHQETATLSRRVDQLIERLEQRGVVSEQLVGTLLEKFLESAGPANGARLVARAWSDDAFRRLLLTEPSEAAAEIGINLSRGLPFVLRVVANSPGVHNVICCTLCSCYPVALLGPPPTWYKREAYRSRVVRDPRGVLREFGLELPDDVEVRVWDSSSEARYMVLPLRPEGTEHLSEDELADLVTRDALIGTAVVTAPAASRDR